MPELTSNIIDVVGGDPTARASLSVPRAWMRSAGALFCDWRGTISGTGYTLDTAASCPADTAVVGINGDGTTDGTTGNPGSSQATQSFSSISTVNLKMIGMWVLVPKRNTARKNYRNVPLKALLAIDGTFAKFLTFVFNAKADGRWHFYTLDVAGATNTGSFSVGTDTIGCIRVRASIDAGCNANAMMGTACLQVGETAFFGGVSANPRAQAMALVRFDDMMDNLYSVKRWNVTAPYSGVSGVTVPIGSYTAFELLNFYGMKGCAFILTRYLNSGGSPYFESISGLRALQDAGWEICFQTHTNPLSASNYGVRLLGPLGVTWFAQASNSYVTNGTITTIAANDFANSTGQGTPITLTGTPPAPLVAGTTYWVRAFSTTTHRLYATESDSLANINAIQFASSGSASWGWGFAGATGDNSAINADFSTGIAAMQAAGLNGWRHWAPNQGAFDVMLEEAFYANGMSTCWPIQYSQPGSALGIPSTFSLALGLTGYVTHLPTFMQTLSAYATDGGSSTESAARAYVQNLCKYGGIGQNYHHNASNVTVLLAYLDELKYRQDRGEIVVVTPTTAATAVSALRLDA